MSVPNPENKLGKDSPTPSGEVEKETLCNLSTNCNSVIAGNPSKVVLRFLITKISCQHCMSLWDKIPVN